jgi:hypothetical protein
VGEVSWSEGRVDSGGFPLLLHIAPRERSLSEETSLNTRFLIYVFSHKSDALRTCGLPLDEKEDENIACKSGLVPNDNLVSNTEAIDWARQLLLSAPGHRGVVANLESCIGNPRQIARFSNDHTNSERDSDHVGGVPKTVCT